MNRLLTRCPVCAEEMHVTEVACVACGTRVQSLFEPCGFCQAAPEHLEFLTVFLRCRGNLTAVGEELGISHPTVGKRLDAALAALGIAPSAAAPPPPLPPRADRKELERARIIELLDRGEITAEEATRRLKDL